jgi:twitching motility protein PilT
MLPTPAIRNLIREEKVHQIYSMLQAGSKVGMQTMSQSLAELVRAGKVSKDEALARAPLPDELLTLLSGAGAGTPPAGNAYTTGLGGARR